MITKEIKQIYVSNFLKLLIFGLLTLSMIRLNRVNLPIDKKIMNVMHIEVVGTFVAGLGMY